MFSYKYMNRFPDYRNNTALVDYGDGANFTWDTYLGDTKTTAVPSRAFKTVSIFTHIVPFIDFCNYFFFYLIRSVTKIVCYFCIMYMRIIINTFYSCSVWPWVLRKA